MSTGGNSGLTCFTNCHLCISGELIPQDLYFNSDTGFITPNYYFRTDGIKRIDLGGLIVSPGFLDLQTNGMGGVHFTELSKGDDNNDVDDDDDNDDVDKNSVDEEKLHMISKMEIKYGVTGWWATIPTVERKRWKEILPVLKPHSFRLGADLLGAHCEGPYLHSSKKGAHNHSHFQIPSETSPMSIYGVANLESSVRMITVAPELPGTTALIGQLQEEYPQISISLGHSSATFEDGMTAVEVGAKALTHVFNAMAPLQHRNPGLAGLMATDKVYYSIIPDGIHLHPSILTLALRTNPAKCILITDSIELMGLPDGNHPGHGQIPHRQQKKGNKVTIEGTDTLIGSCCSLDECVRNMVQMTRCGLAEAVRCVTENIASMMNENKRGFLEPGRRADFVVMDQKGIVKQTWMAGVLSWDAEHQ